MRYILVDTMNLFFRAKHVMHPSSSLTDKIGMSMHLMLASANKVVKRMDIDHVVFCLEGGNNWRKEFYPPYKRQRAAQRQARTEVEVEEDDLYFEMYNELLTYLQEKTNCSVIAVDKSEADDVIARFTILHPDDEHIILSSDTDYDQLINKRISRYNGITSEHITIDGNFNDKNNIVIDKKTNLPKIIDDPAWLLFEKCIRGDKSDNVFSAYPGVRKKGTKKKTGLLEAFADKDKQGFEWNNLMLQRWMDHEAVEHRVLDDYERNRKLIDLTQQPQEIINEVDEGIINQLLIDSIKCMPAKNVSFGFMKFCGKHDLIKLAQYPESIVSWMSKPYKGHILKYMEIEGFKSWTKLKQNQ